MGSKQNNTVKLAQRMARAMVAEQTRARIAMGFDAALIAANKTFHMGPGRAAQFANDYNEAMEWLAEMFISDAEENHDYEIAYAKGKRDELIKKIVGEENFVPFDEYYGEAYIDELKRIRLMSGHDLEEKDKQIAKLRELLQKLGTELAANGEGCKWCKHNRAENDKVCAQADGWCLACKAECPCRSCLKGDSNFEFRT